MMLLLRVTSSVTREERRAQGEREAQEECWLPGGAVAVMGELSNAPLSKLPGERRVTTRD